jgi:hypothetical protein
MPRGAPLWFPVLLLLVLQGLLLARDDWSVLRGELTGPDDYMRLDRVIELQESGAWYSTIITRANVPYGEHLHWTRPLDALLLAGAAPLSLFTDFRTALHWWGVMISPVLHLLALLALIWAVTPLMDRRALVYVGLMALCQPALLFYFMPGRPDHHSLLYLLFAVSIGLGLRLVRGGLDRRLAIGAGAVAALAVWVGVESLVPAAYLIGGLGLLWLAVGEDFARKGLWTSVGLFGGTVVALLLERPWHDLGAVQYNRLSVVHLVVAGLMLSFWLAASVLERWPAAGGRRSGRVALAAAGVGVVGGVIVLAFPKLFAGPMTDLDPRIAEHWVSLMVPTMRPLVWPDDPVGSLRNSLIYVGSAVLALPAALAFARRPPAAEARCWAFLALGLAGFLVLGLFGPQGHRWATYAAMLLAPPYAGLLFLVLQRLGLERMSSTRSATAASGAGGASRLLGTVAVSAGSTVTIIVFGVGFSILAALLPQSTAGQAKGERECTAGSVASYLNATEAFSDRPQHILALPILGAELLYRTPHKVVATGYAIWSPATADGGTGTSGGRSPAGLVDTYDFFSAAENDTAYRIVAARGVDLVLICPYSNEHALYRRADGASTLYERLAAGDLPPWLREVPLPEDLASYFRLFRVSG